MKFKTRIIVLMAILLVVLSIGHYANAANLSGKWYMEQYTFVPMTLMTAADDTSDVVVVRIDIDSITWHLVASSVDDSLHVIFEGSPDNSDSTWTNCNSTGAPTKITASGPYTFSFTNASAYYFYRYRWISESGGSGCVLSGKVVLGRKNK